MYSDRVQSRLDRLKLPEKPRNLIMLAWGFVLAGWFIPLIPVAGLIMAYIISSDAEGYAVKQHCRYIKSTMWTAIVIMSMLIFVLLMTIFGGYGSLGSSSFGFYSATPFVLFWVISICVSLFCTYRSVRGLVMVYQGHSY